MASTDPKNSLLGSISPWNLSRGTTPKPKDDGIDAKWKEEHLRRSSGQDHTPSNRPLPSPRRYPADCPPLKARWFYAVDVPKRKPLPIEQSADEKSKPSLVPKKFTPFSASDSISIESAFQKLANRDASAQTGVNDASAKVTRVPVNEDYLFDVVIEKRELEPAYWLGPVYEVRRGSWFYPEGSRLRPCEENLANQLEEGYLKIAPWRQNLRAPARATSQSPARSGPMLAEGSKNSPSKSEVASTDTGGSPKLLAAESQKPEQAPNSYRLFGSHMNTTVSYQDSTTAWLASDDFMSRMSNTLAGYSGFGAFSGTKVVRGYSQTTGTKAPDSVKISDAEAKPIKRRSAPPETLSSKDESEEKGESEEEGTTAPPKRTALERQLSSLAGEPGNESSEDLAEEARQQEEKEMEDYKEVDGDDQGRPIEHLVLVTHGIGQRLGLRLDSINFIHDVNTLRKTMKAVYANAPDLQALNSQFKDADKNCRVICLPIMWRHLLDFPKQSVRQNKKEYDLGDIEVIDEDDYPSLSDITVDGVPSVRNLITDLAMDVLLYQSAYREHIAGIVQRECNRVYRLFKERNPDFSGRVSLCGHSLGSAVFFDILCRQKDSGSTRLRNVSKTRTDNHRESGSLQLDFVCENFFALGSPIALFQMLKGRTIAARQHDKNLRPAQSPFDPDPMDPLEETSKYSRQNKTVIPISVSSPKCDQLFNIFHPTDPIAYRIEPLISPAMASLKPQLLPYTKKGLFGAPGIVNIGARVGQSVGSMWYNFTSGVASSLLNRSLGITGEEQALSQDKFQGNVDKKNQQQGQQIPVADNQRQQALAHTTIAGSSSDKHSSDHLPTLIDSELETLYAGFQKRRMSQQSNSPNPLDAEFDEAEEKAKKLKREEAKVRALNGNGRVDYSIQEGTFDISLLASIASHLSYWADEDVNHFMVGQMLSKSRKDESR